jgi:hypothetical protein
MPAAQSILEKFSPFFVIAKSIVKTAMFKIIWNFWALE